jgi:hypothetical protein
VVFDDTAPVASILAVPPLLTVTVLVEVGGPGEVVQFVPVNQLPVPAFQLHVELAVSHCARAGTELAAMMSMVGTRRRTVCGSIAPAAIAILDSDWHHAGASGRAIRVPVMPICKSAGAILSAAHPILPGAESVLSPLTTAHSQARAHPKIYARATPPTSNATSPPIGMQTDSAFIPADSFLLWLSGNGVQKNFSFVTDFSTAVPFRAKFHAICG